MNKKILFLIALTVLAGLVVASLAQAVPQPLAIKVALHENEYVMVSVVNLASGRSLSGTTNQYGEATFDLNGFAFNGDSIKVSAKGQTQSFSFQSGTPKTLFFDFLTSCPEQSACPVVSCPPIEECPTIESGVESGLLYGGYGFIAGLLLVLVSVFKGPMRIQKRVKVTRSDGTYYYSWKTVTQKTYNELRGI